MTSSERTAEDLAADADVTPEEIAAWAEAGLLPILPDGGFGADCLARARLLRFATRRGLRTEAVADAVAAQDDLLDRYLSFLSPPAGRGRSLEDAAAELGLSVEEVRRLWVASGFGDETRMFDADVEAFRGLQAARAAGLPDEALLQVARVFGDTMARAADAEVRLFHFYVHEQLRSSGLPEDEVAELTTQAGGLLRSLVEPAILYYHGKAWERALREDVLMHLAEDVHALSGAVGELTVAVLFVDLSDYTGLTDAMGDTAAADVLDRFSDLTRDAASVNDGRIVKQIGDEFMIVFPDAAAAVRCGLELLGRAADLDRFPGLRIGAHIGTVLYREADYLGATVNVAARATAVAGRGDFVVTDAVREGAVDVSALVWEALGAHDLKGVHDPVVLYRVSARGAQADRAADPVCGMELDADRSVFTTSWEGRDVLFCSQRCQDRFNQDPAAYVEQ
jgi:adenylate cyclase